MKKLELNRVKEVGKKMLAGFICSETGSVGVKNAATLGVLIGAMSLSQSSSEAILDAHGCIIEIIVAI